MSEWSEQPKDSEPMRHCSHQELKIVELMVRIFEINPSVEQMEQAIRCFRRLVHRTQIGRTEEMN